jgi:hypothetical protein
MPCLGHIPSYPTKIPELRVYSFGKYWDCVASAVATYSACTCQHLAFSYPLWVGYTFCYCIDLFEPSCLLMLGTFLSILCMRVLSAYD